jgi:DNA-directed RNA polymerase subunit M/transcription elongation factor TFIIS
MSGNKDKFCTACGNMFKMQILTDGLYWECLSCGVREKQVGGCLLVETLVQERSSEGYRILLNEFTRQDATLPHVKNIKCPRGDCGSNGGGAERDVIYIKYDPVNMKYMYICNVCGETWRSRA